jgi:hypothetical protein
LLLPYSSCNEVFISISGCSLPSATFDKGIVRLPQAFLA